MKLSHGACNFFPGSALERHGGLSTATEQSITRLADVPPVLADAGGFDTYLDGDGDGGSGDNKRVVPKGAFGAQVDASGP